MEPLGQRMVRLTGCAQPHDLKDIRIHLWGNRTIMYHIGVATQHPPLPESDQLSELGINFIKECLTVDSTRRPSAFELMDHPWMLDFRKALQNYDEAEMAKIAPAEMPSEDAYESATVARQAAMIQEKEVEAIKSASPDPSLAEVSLPIGESLLHAIQPSVQTIE
jgi:mitogen-activated protein kinase kinase kinase